MLVGRAKHQRNRDRRRGEVIRSLYDLEKDRRFIKRDAHRVTDLRHGHTRLSIGRKSELRAVYKALCGGSQCEFEFQLMASEVRAVVMADSLQDRVSCVVTNVVDAHNHVTHEIALNNANVSQL